jgi:hypothetical protein
MSLEGTFRDFPITDIFQLIGMQKKTGVLALEVAEQKIRVFFSEGKVIWAEDNLRIPEVRLGVLLLNAGCILKEQLEGALARQKETRERLGFILLQAGHLRGQDLERALERQVFETASQVFRWKEGRYQFSPVRNLEIRERLIEPFPVENLLLEAMLMLDEWPLIERELPSFDRLLDKGRQVSDRIQMERFNEDERRIFDLADGTKNLRGIVEASHLNEFDTCKILAGFLRSGVLETRACPSTVPEAKSPALPSEAVLSQGISFLASAVAIAVLLLLGNIFILHSDSSNLIPFSPSGEKEVALAKSYRARLEIKGWSNALRQFYAEWGSWPTALSELGVGRKGADLREEDPWGRAYQYQHEDTAFRIRSLGRDGIEGTADDVERQELDD